MAGRRFVCLDDATGGDGPWTAGENREIIVDQRSGVAFNVELHDGQVLAESNELKRHQRRLSRDVEGCA